MQVVPRPHRPPTPSVIPQDSTPVGKQDKKDGRCVILKVYVQSTFCQMGIIGPGIECLSKGTYHLSDNLLAGQIIPILGTILLLQLELHCLTGKM